MRLVKSVLFLSVLASVFTVHALAQSTATLSGTATDPSGAVLPNAQVTVHSLATGLDRVLKTDGAGLYAVPSLEPGDYKVQANAPGFSTYTVQKVTLDVDQMVSVNMKLAVATAGETVQVESTASQIEAQTITVGQAKSAASLRAAARSRSPSAGCSTRPRSALAISAGSSVSTTMALP